MTEFEQILNNVQKDQSPFFTYFEDHDDEFIIDTDYTNEFGYGQIVYLHKPTRRYIYVDYDENDAYVDEVKKIARLWFDYDAEIPGDEILYNLIDNDFCGQENHQSDKGYYYAWYKFI